MYSANEAHLWAGLGLQAAICWMFALTLRESYSQVACLLALGPKTGFLVKNLPSS